MVIDARKHARVAELFEAARYLSPRERERFLRVSTAGDAEVLAELRALLSHADASSLALDRPVLPFDLVAALPATEQDASGGVAEHPEVVGSYRVLGVLGRGGMGIVYRAEQEHPRREVALKMLQSGLASAEHLRRFEREVEVLGRLQHPGIARIYEAGSAPGPEGARPWFAMELVRGEGLIEHAERRSLDLRSRLALVVRVAAAVQHAHQHGVVHRDLKPANVLVDAEGQPKVLDFGIARAVDADVRATAVRTGAGELLGTLPYMAPEQVAGDPGAIDARTDVHALGVVTYELLAGRLPHAAKGNLVALARAIREEEPVKLGMLRRDCAGDVETIVAKALEKDPSRRYASAAEFAYDVERFLRHEPVLARPASAGYRVRRFVRRHRIVVGATVTTIVALAGGLLVALAQAKDARAARDLADQSAKREGEAARKAEAEAERARTEAERARTEAHKSEGLMHLWLEVIGTSHQGADYRLSEALDEFAKLYEREFEGQDETLAALRGGLAQAYENLGEEAKFGALVAKLVVETPARLGPDHKESIGALVFSGMLALRQERFADAVATLEDALARSERRAEPDPLLTFNCVYNLADALRRSGRTDEARALLREHVAPLLRHFGATSVQAYFLRTELATLDALAGELEPARKEFEWALEAARASYGPDHDHVPESLRSLAQVAHYGGRDRDAIRYAREALAILERTHPKVDDWVLANREELAMYLCDVGERAEARVIVESCVEPSHRVFGPMGPLWCQSFLAKLQGLEGDDAGAVELLQGVLAQQEELLPPEHPDLVSTKKALAMSLLTIGRHAEAVEHLRDVLELQTRTIGPDAPDALDTRGTLAGALIRAGKGTEALQEAETSFAGFRALKGADHPATIMAETFLGGALLRAGRGEEGERRLVEVLDRALARGRDARNSAEIASALLAERYASTNRPEEAERVLARVRD